MFINKIKICFYYRQKNGYYVKYHNMKFDIYNVEKS